MLSNIFAGLIIGIGFILPGVSGGVIAVIMNVYEDLVYSLNNLLKEPKKSLKTLIPIGIGVCIGAFLIGKLIKFLLFEKGYNEPYFIFMGLILGSIPILISKVKEKSKPNYIAIFISFALSLLLFIYGKNLINFSTEGNISLFGLFITGFIFAVGKIVPGISSSFILMLVGTYEYFINLITNPIKIISGNVLGFVMLIIGIAVGAIIFIKLMHYLLKNYYVLTYSIITGFVVGSVIAIYPGLSLDIRGFISIILFILSLIFSYYFSKNKTN